MTNAILRGKPDAGNPHVRFDEGEVASVKPRRGSLLYKIYPAVFSVLAALSAEAAQWSQTTGGNLDDPKNWGTGYSTFAIRKAQSAPFTISSSPTNLPGAGTLKYDQNANTYTNDFGKGGVFDMQNYGITVESGAQVVQTSGKFLSGGTSSLIVDVKAASRSTGVLFDGADSSVEMANLTLNAVAEETAAGVYPYFFLDHGAQATFTAVTASGKGVVKIANGSTLTANALAAQNGGVITSAQATVVLNPPSGSKLMTLEALGGGRMEFVGSTVDYAGEVTFSFNGDANSLIAFRDSTVDFGTKRVGMNKDTDGLVVRFDNTTATHSGDTLFITGGGSASEDAGKARTLAFSGAGPQLTISGNQGLYLRGGTVDLEFDIPKEGFATDRAVVDLTNADAKFSKDKDTVATLHVKVHPKCAPGTYTLLKGKNAGTFIPEENVTCDHPKAKFIRTTIGGVDALQVKIGGAGLILIFM